MHTDPNRESAESAGHNSITAERMNPRIRTVVPLSRSIQAFEGISPGLHPVNRVIGSWAK